MKVLSLFDGISCGMVALERAGIPVERYVAYEIDPYAIKISQKNYPQVEHYGDVTTADFTQFKGFDLVIGGSPCQGFTFAGKQLNFDDPRSKLFFEFVRALEEVKPKYFLYENVKMKTESRDIISKYLGVEPIAINSSLLTAARRDRLYWTNIPNVTQPEDKGLLLKDIVRPEDDDNHHLSATHHAAFLKSYKWTPCQLDEKAKPLLASYYKQPPHCPYIPCDKSESGFRMLSPVECERLQTLPDNYTEGISKTQRWKCIGNGWSVDIIAHILRHIPVRNGMDVKHCPCCGERIIVGQEACLNCNVYLWEVDWNEDHVG